MKKNLPYPGSKKNSQIFYWNLLQINRLISLERIFSPKPLPFYLLVISVFLSLHGYSQIDYSAKVNLKGLYSRESELPFWFNTNQRGRISENTNFAGWISGNAKKKIGANSVLEFGAGLLFQDDADHHFQIDELYAQLNSGWLQVIAGKKQREKYYAGLSAVNENIMWSLNAQPMPGIQISTATPIYFTKEKHFGFEASWNEFVMGDQEFVKDTRVHNSSFYLVYNFSNDWTVKAGLQHVAQWGGTSPVFGKQPTGISDYLRIITARKGGIMP